jgi:CheY-like chemotaxis protein
MALTLLLHQPFDLILTDYELPGINGLKLARQVGRNWPNTRIVLMRNHSLPHILAAKEPADFDGYVPKPFSLAQMFVEVDALLGREAGKD